MVSAINEIADLARKHSLIEQGESLKVIEDTSRRKVYAATSGRHVTIAGGRTGVSGQRLRVLVEDAPRGRAGGVFVQTTPACTTDLARVAAHDRDGRAIFLTHYSGDPLSRGTEEDLNPPMPRSAGAQADDLRVAVALIDTGINYLLPLFGNRLARDANGHPIAFDFADNDTRPFDLDPTASVYFPRRHGTAVASIVLEEAPDAIIVPLRYPGRAFGRFGDLVRFAAQGPARIAAMPLGSAKKSHWTSFETAARDNPQILFVVSAGNDGRDIDTSPVFPASLDLDNILTVTSSDAFGRIAAGSNWGTVHVDVAVPGERIPVTDHLGARRRASGSSYAVPRVAALAARLSADNPEWDARRLKSEIVDLATPLSSSQKPVKHGWIPNPAIE